MRWVRKKLGDSYYYIIMKNWVKIHSIKIGYKTLTFKKMIIVIMCLKFGVKVTTI